jgi:peptidoglycan-associated lipoprotein
MPSRAQFRLAIAVVVISIGGCHKQVPPVTQPTPMAAPPAPAVAATSSPGTGSARPIARPESNTSAANAARRKLVESIGDMIHFDYNEAVLRPGDKTILDAKAALLQANPGIHLRITGNCDERGSDQYNIALGMRRAMAAKEYLGVVGIDGARIEVASLGREAPLDPAHTEEAWEKNRRDEFTITAGAPR